MKSYHSMFVILALAAGLSSYAQAAQYQSCDHYRKPAFCNNFLPKPSHGQNPVCTPNESERVFLWDCCDAETQQFTRVTCEVQYHDCNVDGDYIGTYFVGTVASRAMPEKANLCAPGGAGGL